MSCATHTSIALPRRLCAYSYSITISACILSVSSDPTLIFLSVGNSLETTALFTITNKKIKSEVPMRYEQQYEDVRDVRFYRDCRTVNMPVHQPRNGIGIRVKSARRSSWLWVRSKSYDRAESMAFTHRLIRNLRCLWTSFPNFSPKTPGRITPKIGVHTIYSFTDLQKNDICKNNFLNISFKRYLYWPSSLI